MADRLPVRHGPSSPGHREEVAPHQRSDRFYGPFAELDDFFDRMVGRVFGSNFWPDWSRGWTPPVDIEETDDAWLFEAELPGVQRDDIEVEIGDSELIISGKVEERERDRIMRRRARHTGWFEYRATVPRGIDGDLVDAQFENGLLMVRVPRPEQTRTRRIKVN